MSSGQKLFACPICDKKFKFSSTYKIHQAKHKKAETKSKGSLQNIVDDQQHKEADGYPNKSEHNERKTRHQTLATKTLRNGNKPKEDDNSIRIFACQICKQTFSNRSHLMRHKNKHLGKNYQCELCGHSYTSRWSLKVHLLGHQNVRPWACDQCGARFYQRNHLKRHIKIHTGERDQICEQCGKTFIDKGGLLAHQQTHIDKEGITCTICGLHLKHKTSMRAHLKLHKGVKEFTCDVCKRSFAQKKTYTAHKKLHANIEHVRHVGFLLPPKAFCAVCNRGFVNSTSLKKHAKKHELGLLKRNKHVNPNVNLNSSFESQNGSLHTDMSKDIEKNPDNHSLSTAVGKGRFGRVQFLKEVQLRSCVVDELDEEMLCSETTYKMERTHNGNCTVHHNMSSFTDAAEVKKGTIVLLKIVNKPNLAVTNYLTSPSTLINQSNVILTDKPMPASALGDSEKEGAQNKVFGIDQNKTQTQTQNKMALQNNKSDVESRLCLDNDSTTCQLNLKENTYALHREAVKPFDGNETGTITTNKNVFIDNQTSDEREGTSVEILKSHSLESTTESNNIIRESYQTSISGEDNHTSNYNGPLEQAYSDVKKSDIGNPIEKLIDLSRNNDDIQSQTIELPERFKDSDVPSKPIDARSNTTSHYRHGVVSKSDSSPSLHSSVASTFYSDTPKHEHRNNDAQGGRSCSNINSVQESESLLNDNSSIEISHSNNGKAEEFIMCDTNKNLRKNANDHPSTVQRRDMIGIALSATGGRILDGAGHEESDGSLDECLEEVSNGELCGTRRGDACILTNDGDSMEHTNIRPDICLVHKVDELNKHKTSTYLNKGELYPGTTGSEDLPRNMFNKGNTSSGCKKSATEEPHIRRRELECTRLQPVAQTNQLKTSLCEQKTLNRIQTKKHSNSKYTCTLCDRSFTTMRTLGIHSKNLHGNSRVNGLAMNRLETSIEVKQLNKHRVKSKDSSGNNSPQLRRSSLRFNREGYKSRLRTHVALYTCDVNHSDKLVSHKKALNVSKERNVDNEETSEQNDVTHCNDERNKLVKQNTCFTVQPTNKNNIERSDEQNDKDSRQTKYFAKRKDSLCEMCGKEFFKRAHLERHLERRSCVKPSTCSLCGKGFKTAAILETHIGKHHNKGFPCNICEKVFVTTDGLRRHKLAHIDESPYLFVPPIFECQLCGKRYTSKSSLKDHTQQHQGVRFMCDTCGKGYSRRHHLTRHISVAHLGIRPFICNVDGCNKAFSYADALDCHKRVHTGVKTYQCSECGKCFTQSQGLRIHMKKHRGVKEFKCEICHQEFSVKMSMLRHVKRHTVEDKSGGENGKSGKPRPVKKMAEKSQSCMQGCGRMFTTKRAVVTHLRKHCPLTKSTSV